MDIVNLECLILISKVGTYKFEDQYLIPKLKLSLRSVWPSWDIEEELILSVDLYKKEISFKMYTKGNALKAQYNYKFKNEQINYSNQITSKIKSDWNLSQSSNTKFL